MTEPIVLRNDVPMFERLLAAFFVAVGGPLTYLGFTQSQELPDPVVPVVQVGLPLFLIVFVWWAFAKRRRVVVLLDPVIRWPCSKSACSLQPDAGRPP